MRLTILILNDNHNNKSLCYRFHHLINYTPQNTLAYHNKILTSFIDNGTYMLSYMCFLKAVKHCRIGPSNARMYYHLREN